MLRWEAHRALSASIGDTVTCTSAVIPDGVRYTRAMRDSYLYRAMLKSMEQALQIIAGAPRQAAISIISKLFNGMVLAANLPMSDNGGGSGLTNYSARLDLLARRPVFIMSALAKVANSGTNHDYVPIPLRDYGAIASLVNSRNIQRSDPFGAIYDHPTSPFIEVWADDVTLIHPYGLDITYLPYPSDPATQAFTDRLGNFQLSMMNTVIGLATLFAKIDDQETGSLERFVPQLMETHVGGNSNVGNNPAQ